MTLRDRLVVRDPITPTLVREPFHRDGWLYEEKVDGWWIIAYKDGGRVRLVCRNGRAHTRRFPDRAAAVAKLSARTLVLEREVAIFDQQLRSRFDWLREPDPAAVATPPIYIVFDVMFRDCRDLAGLPLAARRIHLEDVIAGAAYESRRWQVVDRIARHGASREGAGAPARRRV